MARRRTGLEATEVMIAMPREYSDHPICEQLMKMKDEEALKDVEVTYGAQKKVGRESGFLLCLLSPVWRAKLLGDRRWREQRVVLEAGEADVLESVLKLGCGGGGGQVMRRGLEELIEVGRFAERYQVVDVRRAVEEEAIKHLKLETCGDLLAMCEKGGLQKVEEACRRMALIQFEELTKTKGFLRIGEEMLRSLLEDEELECGKEETVFEGLIRWMKSGGGGKVRGENLLQTIRFPLMRERYLIRSAQDALPGSKRLERLVSEALMLKNLPPPGKEHGKNFKYLGVEALRQRLVRRVTWDQYTLFGEDRARRLPASSTHILCLADGGDWVCGGRDDGSISVWNKASLEVERTLTGHSGSVCALAECEGWLKSGSRDAHIRVWKVSSGKCVRILEGLTASVCCLTVSNRMLLSGSDDGTVRMWRLEGEPSKWLRKCEQTFTMPNDSCQCLAWWGNKAVSGCESGAIEVWDLSTGKSVHKLQRHKEAVTALLVWGDRLISASEDTRVLEWCLKSGARVQRLMSSDEDYHRIQVASLAMSGRKLVWGLVPYRLSRLHQLYEVLVRDVKWSGQALDGETSAEALDGETSEEASESDGEWNKEHMLVQPDECCDRIQLEIEGGRFRSESCRWRVHALLAMDGEVWGAVGKQLVVWGRDA